MDVTSNFQTNTRSLSRLQQNENLKKLGIFGGRVGNTRECLGCRGRGVARGGLFARSLRLDFVEAVTFNNVLHTRTCVQENYALNPEQIFTLKKPSMSPHSYLHVLIFHFVVDKRVLGKSSHGN